MSITRRFLKKRYLLALALVGAGIVAAIAGRDTMATPDVRHIGVALPGMATGADPVTIALLADIHVAGPDMPPERLARIVAQVNALEPDLVLIAGDFVSDKRTATRHYAADEALAPLRELGTTAIAVPGNHDHWRSIESIGGALAKAGITVLRNEAVEVGPLVIGGLDDDFTRHADLPATLSAMREHDGGRIIVSHSPDPFPDLPEGTGLLLAGHTHCGQIRYPWGGSPATMSRYGQKYACGIVQEDGNILVASSGLGTSVLPFRFLTRPEIWLVTVRPAQ